MTNLNKIYLYRMTHIGNISHILQHGITHSSSPNSNPKYLPIGDGSLISTRNSRVLTDGRNLGNFIPFYFGARMPMLYVIQKGLNGVNPTLPENIIYCISSVSKIIEEKLDFVFTNGHAVDRFTSFYFPDSISNIEGILDYNAIHCKYWKDENDLDLKRRKEAEFLVGYDISVLSIVGYVVYNELAKSELLKLGIEEAKIIIKKEFYF